MIRGCRRENNCGVSGSSASGWKITLVSSRGADESIKLEEEAKDALKLKVKEEREAEEDTKWKQEEPATS